MEAPLPDLTQHLLCYMRMCVSCSFFADPSYKEYLENATAFNRKLNEERKMRIPYIDGQTGVAQRHYNTQRVRRERMPPSELVERGGPLGQVLAYPQKQWKKRRYQYLKFFMQPRRTYDPEAEMHTISQIENPTLNDDSNTSGGPKDEGAKAVSGETERRSSGPGKNVEDVADIRITAWFFTFRSGDSMKTKCLPRTMSITKTQIRTSSSKITAARRKRARLKEERPKG